MLGLFCLFKNNFRYEFWMEADGTYSKWSDKVIKIGLETQ